MKRLLISEFKEGMKVRWQKGGVTEPQILEVHQVQKSRTGKTSVQFKDPTGRLVTNHNPSNRYVSVDS